MFNKMSKKKSVSDVLLIRIVQIRRILRIRLLYIFLLFIISLILSSNVMSEVYNTSRPIIQVDYYEIPVDILYYNLTDINGASWPVYPLSSTLVGLSHYNFTIDYIDNGDYVFFVLAKDSDDNQVTATKEFTIDHGGMKVWLISPKPAIGKTPRFNITVGSQFQATCKYMTILPENCDQICRYNSENGYLFDETGSRTIHKIVNYAAPIIDRPLYVICRSDIPGANLSDERNYGSTSFMVGYDTQPPIITNLSADPNPVVDVNAKRTTVTVNTNEPTVCRIYGGNANFENGIIDEYFENADPTNYWDYNETHQMNISYRVFNNNMINPFRYNITCNDRANRTVNASLTVIVHINSTLLITQVTPSFVDQRNILYEIKTNLQTIGCYLSLDRGTSWLQMNQNNPRNYTLQISLNLGENNISVYCIADEVKYSNFSVTVDDVDPVMNLIMHSETCSLSEINFIMNATDEGTGIDYLNYSIWNGNIVIRPWTQTNDNSITFEAQLEDGEIYTVKANAFDRAGRMSNTDEKNIIAHGPGSIACDLIAPTLNVSYVGNVYQKNVTVTCTDNPGGSGCKDYFDYQKITSGSCNSTSYNERGYYSQLPLIITEDTILCIKGYDLAENFRYINISVPVQTISCGNNIAEPGLFNNDPEQCDGTDLRGFTCYDFTFNGGILGCTPPDGTSNECKWDTSNCQIGNRGYCGDNVTNNYYKEQCDGSNPITGDWGDIRDCTDFGFTGGTLSCNPPSAPDGERCMFNTSGCYKNPSNPTPNCDGFGGSFLTLLDPTEQCEPYLFENNGVPNLSCSSFDSFYSGELKCTNSCVIDISNCSGPPPEPFCGDGIIGPGEKCDPPGSTVDCDELDDGAYTGGTLVCGNNCQWVNFVCTLVPECGNNIREGLEECDGPDLGNVKCTDIRRYIGGNLSCFPKEHPDRCTFNKINCDLGFGYCGDGIINNFLEQCDGDSWGRISKQPNEGCRQFGFAGGTLRCYPPFSDHQCMFDTSGCIDNSPLNRCGDGILQSGEQCELDRPFNLSCNNFDSYNNGTLRCDYNTCFFDISDCKITEAVCGNGIIELNETCDLNNFGDLDDCSEIRPTLTGPLYCNPPGSPEECRIDITKCDSVNNGTGNYTGNDTGICGNGIIDFLNNEVCDGSNLGGMTCDRFYQFVGGELRCFPPTAGDLACTFDKSRCDEGFGYCGDNITNDFPNEQCDGSDPISGDWGRIRTCSDINPSFVGGTLRCDNCRFDTSLCDDGIVSLQVCGDGVVQSGEQCDPVVASTLSCSSFDNFDSGTLSCSSDCNILLNDCRQESNPCGNGQIEPGERCDGSNLGGSALCAVREPGIYIGGTLSCNPPGSDNECMLNYDSCIYNSSLGNGECGDGAVNASGEECDGSDFRGATCADIGGFVGGTLRCNPPDSAGRCTFNTSNCDIGHGYCGDGIVNNLFFEQCDGSDWGRISKQPNEGCRQLGFSGGTLRCNPPYSPNQCLFDTSSCTGIPGGYCGDRILNPGEQCELDRPIVGNCTLFDHFIGGFLGCNYDSCTLDISDCMPPTLEICGDGYISGDEDCDGSNLGGFQCTDFVGLVGGTLKCNPPSAGNLSCKFNFSSCIIGSYEEFCGDGLLNNFPNEQCDMGTNSLTCLDFNFTGGILTCDSNCSFNTTLCTSPYSTGYCGDGHLNPSLNEQCEPNIPLDLTCYDLGFAGGELSCNPPGSASPCRINVSSCIEAVNEGRCGDGYILSSNESCDSNNLGGADCTLFDDFAGGLLQCDDLCYWDTSNCNTGKGYCGDGIINNPYNEQCDGSDWGRISKEPNEGCRQFGFTGGTLSCNPPNSSERCTFDTSQCITPIPYGVCGDTVINKGEQCERGKSLNVNCTDFDRYIGGNISCDYSTCNIDLSKCILPVESVCGDGFITGTEDCDGLFFGGITLCSQIDDEFISGSLKCFPPGHRRECQFDFSNCEFIDLDSTCGNGIVESYEECDGESSIFTCEDYSLISGTLMCNNCSVNTSSCIGGAMTFNQSCNNSILEQGEECDGIVNVSEMFEQSFIELYSCQNGMTCSDACTIECLSQVLYTCNNSIKDGDETGLNCGGSCPPCDDGEACNNDSDCKSRSCVEGLCAVDSCNNGNLDNDETAVDCGGSCPPCSDGSTCISDNDCQSGKCVDGVCMESQVLDEKKKPSTAGIILIILGSILILGGSGYVIYEEYFDKKRVSSKNMQGTPVMPSQQQRPQQPLMSIDPKVLELQRRKREERRQQEQEKRKSLLEGFEKESKIKKEDEIETLKERKVNKELLKDSGYIDLAELKASSSTESKSKDVFEKLKKIGKVDYSNDVSSETSNVSESIIKDDSIDEKLQEKRLERSSESGLSESDKGNKSRKIPKIIKVKKKSSTFEKLEKISKSNISENSSQNVSNVQSERISNDTSQKISDLSGKKESIVKKIIDSENISQKQAMTLFSNLDKQKLTSDVFKEIIKDLVDSGKLSKENVSSVLFEYIDKGVLSKAEVAQILSELKML
ncbi:MAG: hypothetical protein KatS3mg002_0470 [Candidatus Woesearchaeota archaeon]|nr:MAG: hypothetical protein KatS3mg002_0470 [Candidatus Woesearchaeota archaeon]